MHGVKSRLVIGLENILFAGVCMNFFSSEILQPRLTKGFIVYYGNISRHTLDIRSRVC